MKALRKIFEWPRRQLFLLISVTALLFTVGCCPPYCGLEQEGDKEPEQGEYRVSVDPSVELTEQSPLAPILLQVGCFGTKLPDNCNANSPGWTSSTILPSYLSYEIIDPSRPDTFANITVTNWNDFASRAPRTSLKSHTDWYLNFVPTHKPEGLDVRPHKRYRAATAR